MTPELTTLQEGWNSSPLHEIAEVRFSNVDKKSKSGEKRVRLCNYTDVYNNEYLIGDEAFMKATATDSEIYQFSIERGDVMITKDSETPDDIGVPAVFIGEPDGIVCGYHLALLRPDKTKINPIFLAR